MLFAKQDCRESFPGAWDKINQPLELSQNQLKTSDIALSSEFA